MGLRAKAMAMLVRSSKALVAVAATAKGKKASCRFSCVEIQLKPRSSTALAAGPTACKSCAGIPVLIFMALFGLLFFAGTNKSWALH